MAEMELWLWRVPVVITCFLWTNQQAVGFKKTFALGGSSCHIGVNLKFTSGDCLSKLLVILILSKAYKASAGRHIKIKKKDNIRENLRKS